MAWTATDNFDGYSTSVDLDTLNGGSGWTGAWTKISGTEGLTIETAPAGGQGGNAVRGISIGANVKYDRSFTAISAGTVRFLMRLSITNPDDFVGVTFGDAGAGSANMYVRFGSTGNIEIYNNDVAGYESLGSYLADTWYTIDLDFDDSAQPDKYRARVNGGSWSDWKGVNGGTYSTIGKLQIDDSNTNAGTFWVDDIGPTPPDAPPSIPLVGSGVPIFVRGQY